MTAGIQIRFDDRDLQRWGAVALKLVERNARNAIDRSARQARAEAIQVMAEDANVPAARFRKATPPVRGTRPGKLVASWTIGKSSNSIRGAGKQSIDVIRRGSPANVQSYVLSGGGSSAMQLHRAFVVRSNGGKAVMTRTGPGKRDIKPIHAESPHTAMQGNRMPQVTWETTARARLGTYLGSAVQAAFDERGSMIAGASDDVSRTRSRT